MGRHLPVCLLLLLGACPGPDHESPPRPNVLFLFSDDHAAQAISAYGSKINETPHLDRLAREGMRFDHCFATNAICAPSRAVVLTGAHSHVNGQLTNAERFDGTQPTLPQLLRAAGYRVICLSNQSGVARGLFTVEDVRKVNDRVQACLDQEGARLDAFYFCPHHPERGDPPYRVDCRCRKPAPGMLEKAAAEYGIDLKKSVVVGDKLSDVETGRRAGLKTILVHTGSLKAGDPCDPEPDFRCADLREAADLILRRANTD